MVLGRDVQLGRQRTVTAAELPVSAMRRWVRIMCHQCACMMPGQLAATSGKTRVNSRVSSFARQHVNAWPAAFETR